MLIRRKVCVTIFLKSTIITVVILWCFILKKCEADETVSTINAKKALHKVNERFLSLTVDPAVLLTGLNLSDISLQLASHLSPAYIRIAGQSTQFVKYVDDDDDDATNLSPHPKDHEKQQPTSVAVSPSMWFGINEWLTAANLTPVFGINDIETTKGVWNPKSTLPLLEMSDKLNVTCLWQLGYDCSNKTELQYKGDLMVFRHILDAFPERKDTWKIVGSDFSRCLGSDHIDSTRRIVDDMENVVNSIMWEPDIKSNDFYLLEKDLPMKLFSLITPKIPVWTTAVKPSNPPISFLSAISWAKQIGDAAKMGYDVIFRQPRLHEIFTDTPAYWVSVMHKKLMGQTVLDVKTTGFNSQVSVYAHCTKQQNSFVRRGAMTVFVVNNGTTNHTALVRMGTATTIIKNTEVQSYILTSSSDVLDTDIFLNGNKLTSDLVLNDESFLLTPKLRRAKLMQYLSLSVPPKSIAFFVLPVARVPVCVSEEDEIKLLMQEITDDQKIPFSEEVSVDVALRSNYHHKPSPSLRDLQRLIEKEFESDENYYKQFDDDYHRNRNTNNMLKPSKIENTVNSEVRNFFIEHAKLLEKQRKQSTAEQKKSQLISLLKENSNRNNEQVAIEEEKRSEKAPVINLELTSGEIRKILTDRAKTKAAKKNIKFTSKELNELMDKATEKLTKSSLIRLRTKKLGKRSMVNDNSGRTRRSINMDLLQLKAARKQPVLSAGSGLLQMRKKQFLERMEKLKTLDRNNANSRGRRRRNINMDLLNVKTILDDDRRKESMDKVKFRNRDNKETGRQQFQKLYHHSNDELRNRFNNNYSFSGGSNNNDEYEGSNDGVIFAKMATSSDEELMPTSSTSVPQTQTRKKVYIKTNPLFPNSYSSRTNNKYFKLPTSTIINPKKTSFDYQKKKSMTKDSIYDGVMFSDTLRIMTASDGVDSVPQDGDLPCIHEYFGPTVQVLDGYVDDYYGKKKGGEFWEIEEIPIMNRVDNNNRIPTLYSRGFELTSNSDNKFDLTEYIKDDDGLHSSLNDKCNLDMSIDSDYDGMDSGSMDNNKPLRFKRSTIGNRRQQKNATSTFFNNKQKTILEERKQLPLQSTKPPSVHSLFDDMKNSLNKKYTPLSAGLKIWKPSDLLKLSRTSNGKVTRVPHHHHQPAPVNDAGIFRSYFNNDIGGRYASGKARRSVIIDADSLENQIEDSFNNDATIRGMKSNGIDEVKFEANRPPADNIQKIRPSSVNATNNQVNFLHAILYDMAQMFRDLTTKLTSVWR